MATLKNIQNDQSFQQCVSLFSTFVFCQLNNTTQAKANLVQIPLFIFCFFEETYKTGRA